MNLQQRKMRQRRRSLSVLANKAVDAIGRLENLANRGSYEYTQEQVDVMFQALEGRVAEIKARFTPKKTAESKTFSFGTTE